ncbi:hypothetical protein AAG570_004897 [Ranatra chinensis]|uniref:Receptor ligand binding region domain-containing protein n=1 Tax=Ranatra chinensis TaxID=642074 RepID=A0ABD0XZ72_9HEMI
MIALYLAVIYPLSDVGVQKSVNRTLSGVSSAVVPLFSGLGPQQSADVPGGGAAFSRPGLEALCRRWEGRQVVAALVLADRRHHFETKLAAAVSGVPLLWAAQSAFAQESLGPLEVRLDAGVVEAVAALRALLISAHWHSYTLLYSTAGASFLGRHLESLLKAPPLSATIVPIRIGRPEQNNRGGGGGHGITGDHPVVEGVPVETFRFGVLSGFRCAEAEDWRFNYTRINVVADGGIRSVYDAAVWRAIELSCVIYRSGACRTIGVHNVQQCGAYANYAGPVERKRCFYIPEKDFFYCMTDHPANRPRGGTVILIRRSMVLARVSQSTKGVIVTVTDWRGMVELMAEAKRLNMVDGNFVWIWVDTSGPGAGLALATPPQPLQPLQPLQPPLQPQGPQQEARPSRSLRKRKRDQPTPVITSLPRQIQLFSSYLLYLNSTRRIAGNISDRSASQSIPSDFPSCIKEQFYLDITGLPQPLNLHAEIHSGPEFVHLRQNPILREIPLERPLTGMLQTYKYILYWESVSLQELQ